jgi:hypothetical protein
MSRVWFSRGDVQVAVGIMLETAQWLEDHGMPHWTLEKRKRLYVSAGFCYIGDRTARIKTHGTVTAALFERVLQQNAGTCEPWRFLV